MDLKLGHTQLIIDTAKEYGLLRNQLAYVLATAYWETAHTMKPVREAYWVKNAEAWRKRNLRYYPWYGRGFVQLTWEANYIKAGQNLGLDLTTDPDRVMEPEVSAKILVHGSMEGWFTGKKITDYITIKRSDFVGARRVINGTDKARAIAEIAREYDGMLKADGYGEVQTPPPATDDPENLDKPIAKSKTFWMWLSTAIGTPLAAFSGMDWRVQLALVAAIVGFAIYGIYARHRLAKIYREIKAGL